jgi:hypothetical protein
LHLTYRVLSAMPTSDETDAGAGRHCG